MEGKRESSLSHKEWRRVAKKERRRRLRRKAAQERDADDERLRATLERSAEYTNWLAEQEKLEKEREVREQREHDENEKLWLEAEVRAQKEWRVHQERKVKARQEQLLQEEILRKDFEAKQEVLRKKKEEAKRLREEEMKRHEDLQREINDYIDNDAPTPEALRVISESQSGKDSCPFFTKTGACRYGDSCSRNHRRVALSKIILVPGFYNHFSLEKNSAEYDTDVSLEFESTETRQDFRDFYESVLPELKTFGRIKTLKCCCNTEIHLRGNLYVEYHSERDAARAWRKLKGRYWAQRQLNCEFVNFKSWRNAVCGMAKCPKGRACNFLHTFRNPNDEYDIKSPPRWKKNDGQEGTSSRRSDQRSISNWDDWEDRETTNDSKNWVWSDSPEAEHRTRREKTHRNAEERGSERRSISRSERRRGESERSNSRNSKNSSDRHKGGGSSRRSRRTEKEVEEQRSSCEKDTPRKREKESRKRRCESDADISRKNSEIRESKVSKSSKNIERDRRKEKKSNKSKHKSRREEEESDENTDTNSNNSYTNVKTSERVFETRKSNPSTPENISKSSRSAPATVNEKKTSERTPTVENQISSAGDSQWDTTDSEGEEKSEDRS